MSSLGYRRGCDHNSSRPGEQATSRTTTVAIPTPPPAPPSSGNMFSVAKGVVPLFVYAAMFMAAPLLYVYASPDYTDTVIKGTVIGVAGAYALAVVLANDCVAWFNMILFFHIGLEVKILDILMSFATSESTVTLINGTEVGSGSSAPSDGDMILAWVGFVVIIVHLVPFLIINNTMILTLLAFAGVIVNAAVTVYLDTSLLLIVGFSSTALLATTLCVGGVCGMKTSLLCCITAAMKDGSWITCTGYKI